MDPTKPLGCANNADGSLKDANDMTWSDPEDDNNVLLSKSDSILIRTPLPSGATTAVSHLAASPTPTSAHIDLRLPAAIDVGRSLRPRASNPSKSGNSAAQPTQERSTCQQPATRKRKANDQGDSTTPKKRQQKGKAKQKGKAQYKPQIESSDEDNDSVESKDSSGSDDKLDTIGEREAYLTSQRAKEDKARVCHFVAHCHLTNFFLWQTNTRTRDKRTDDIRGVFIPTTRRLEGSNVLRKGQICGICR
jgi:hypothetical protein